MRVWQAIFGLLLVAWPARTCWPGYVQVAVEQSDLVLTAKVTHLGSRRGTGLNRVYNLVRLQIKMIMKGEDAYRDHVRNVLIGDGAQHDVTMLEYTDDHLPAVTSDDTLGVDGVSARGTCSGRVRTGDVQLFFLKVKSQIEMRGGHREAIFKVASQPIKLNLEMLRLTEAAAQDVPYEDRTPIEEEPCEKQLCTWGSDCVTDQNGEAICICASHCPPPSSTASPVCGTDGKTYDTMCELRRHACSSSQQNTRIKHSGRCDVPARDEGEDDGGTVARHRGASQDPTGPTYFSPPTDPPSSTTTITTTATTTPTGGTTNTITGTD